MSHELFDEPVTPSITYLHHRLLGIDAGGVPLTIEELAEALALATTTVKPLWAGR